MATSDNNAGHSWIAGAHNNSGPSGFRLPPKPLAPGLAVSLWRAEERLLGDGLRRALNVAIRNAFRGFGHHEGTRTSDDQLFWMTSYFEMGPSN